MLYTAKCYWPGVSADELERVVARAHSSSYRGSLLYPDDALVLCLFDAGSSRAVQSESERVGLPCERLMPTLWLGATPIERSFG